MNYKEYKDKVLAEINEQLESFDEKIVDQFVEELAHKRCANIVAFGAGRMGYGLRAFVMRLIHLGSFMRKITTFSPKTGPLFSKKRRISIFCAYSMTIFRKIW